MEKCDETLNAVNSALQLYYKQRESGEDVIPEDIEELGQGWVAEEALSMSLFASLIYENDFEKGVLFSVNHSGDCDSTGSIVGNILGLINGEKSIPVKWIKNLEGSKLVSQVGEDLFVRVKGDSFNTDDEWWEKYPAG